jgi:hypothetical protein
MIEPTAAVRDEMVRKRTRDKPDTGSQPRLHSALKHPLTAVVIGVVLTWIFGSVLTGRLAERQETRRLAGDFTRQLYDRLVSGELLLSSFAREAPLDEVRARKAQYDAAYLRFNRDWELNRVAIGRVSDTLEVRIVTTLAESLRRSDRHLTAAYDSVLRRDHRAARQEADSARKYLGVLRGCSYTIVGQLRIRTSGERGASRSADHQALERLFVRRCRGALIQSRPRVGFDTTDQAVMGSM